MEIPFIKVIIADVAEIFNSYVVSTITIFIATTITGFTLFWRERKEWRNAHFESRINISLNLVFNNKLHIRTVNEREVKNVILSVYARKLLKKSVNKTTLEEPFLKFETESDAWMVYNEIINAISGIYGMQLLANAGSDDYKENRFLIALTWEHDSDITIQKLRVMMVTAETLEKLSEPDISLESSFHKARIGTLLKMREQFKDNNWPSYQMVSLTKI